MTTNSHEQMALQAENEALRAELEAMRSALNQQASASLGQSRTQTMQRALYQISETTHSGGDLMDIFAQIHHIIGELVPAKNCFIALYDEATSLVSFPYYVDEYDPQPTPRPLSERGLTHRVIRTGDALLMKPDMRAQRIAQGEQIIGSICLDWLGVPLRLEDRVIGALVIQSYHGDVRYSDQDKELLQFVSSQVAAAIERKRTADHIEHLAWHDALTGLPNRALLHERLQQTILLAKRQQRRFAYIGIDLDKFKPINDQYGHAAGDALLVQGAARMLECVRETDTVARVGGDEFIVLLQDVTSSDHALVIAHKICEQLQLPFTIEGREHPISASLGVALFPEHAHDAEPLAACADTALYTAKNAGGNRVCMGAAGTQT
jgi:diguanylate cyclase (GGDEF)-like protein